MFSKKMSAAEKNPFRPNSMQFSIALLRLAIDLIGNTR